MEIFTVGHSNRTLPAFQELLHAHGVAQLVDVRRSPASRRHPHFDRGVLARALPEQGIGYEWRPELGGLREPRAGLTRHTAWREPAFAGYAEHMESDEFRQAALALLEHARRAATAVMCAEASPDACHRRLLADWVLVHGATVLHILAPQEVRAHQLHPAVRVEGDALVYDRGQRSLNL